MVLDVRWPVLAYVVIQLDVVAKTGAGCDGSNRIDMKRIGCGQG